MATSPTNDLDTGAQLRGAGADQKLFGRYTLRKVLGRGGMGVVWLAHDDELERNVAMKFLPDMIVRDREAVEDLKRETRRSLDLTHHHIVRIYDFTQDDQCAAIIMEYVDGESLSALKTRQDGGCFSVSTIQSWVSHFCQAMEYAHRQARVVHRDLKPANLMVNGRGDLKVTDFGISRSMSDSMTRVSMSNSAGTLAYMSPEQALGSPPAIGDDIYAFGATLYDMLTGRPPFFRGNLQVQLETVVPPLMESRRAELGNTGEPIPALWEEVIAACLAKRPQDRPQGMMEIASLLGVGGSTTAGFRPSTGRGTGGGGGPGTSTTMPGTAGTNRTSTTPEVPKTSTAPTAQPPTARTAPSMRALQPTRNEDFGYTPHDSTPPPPPPTSRTEPLPPVAESVPEVEPAPTAPPAPVVAPVEPEPVVEARVEPPPVEIPPAEPPPPVEPEPAPVVAEAPPEIVPAPVVEEPPPVQVAKELPPVKVVPEIPLVPPTDKPVDGEFAATLIMPAVAPRADLAPRKPAPVPPTEVLTPAPSTSTGTNIGHMIGSGAAKKSSNMGLILGGAGAIALIAVLGGMWAGHSKPAKPDPRKIELASHIEAANSALASNDLTTAAREIAAVKSLDPKNAGLAGLQTSLQQKETEKAQQLAAEKAAADKAAKEQLAKEQMAREQAEKERIAKIEAERVRLEKVEQDKARAAAEMAQLRQQQFDAAIAKANEAIGRRDPATARQNLSTAQQIKPSDAELSKVSARIAALEEDLKPKPVTTVAEDPPDKPDKPDDNDTPSKPRRKTPEKKPVAETKPKPKREVEPEPSRPVVQRPSQPPSRPPSPPRRPSNPFGPGGAPGG